jgi:hypothetical protein
LRVKQRLGPFKQDLKDGTKASKNNKKSYYFIKNPNFELH